MIFNWGSSLFALSLFFLFVGLTEMQYKILFLNRIETLTMQNVFFKKKYTVYLCCFNKLLYLLDSIPGKGRH